MKPRVLLAAIVLAVLTATPTIAPAAYVHYFDCTECHRDGATWNSVDGGGVCISCHESNGSTYTFDRTRPDGATTGLIPPGFSTGDASDAFDNGNVPVSQSSHNWGASDRNPAAGASPASTAMYSTRRGASGGMVTCYKCHDPHSSYDLDYVAASCSNGTDTNQLDCETAGGTWTPNPEKMLRTQPTRYTTGFGDFTSANSEQNVEAMCIECHLDWANVTVTEDALVSHPMYDGDYNVDYGNIADNGFKPFAGAGNMQLLTGNKIGCSS